VAAGGDPPAQDPSGEDVNDERDVDDPARVHTYEKSATHN
jgi:hypothetical protein